MRMATAGTLAILFWSVALVSPRTINKVIEESLQSVPSVYSAIPRLSDGTFLTQLDIRLTMEQYEELLNGHSANGDDTRSKRKATPHEYQRWTGSTMPYKISPNGFDTQAVNNIHTAMAEWEQYTCIRFRAPTAQDRNYISIENGEGCNSYVGMMNWGKQIMNLGLGCKSVATALHELGHAIGLHHEQNRQDRDDSIWVRSEHMDPYFRFASDKTNPRDINNYGVPYDYSSIMHYGQDSFSMSQEPTIITHDPTWQFLIGTVTKLSFKDAQVVNIMYKCNAHCPTTTCPTGGFLDQNCQCLCAGNTFGNPIKPCGTPDKPYDNCVNTNSYCDWWASVGECENNPGYMKPNCPKSCDICGSGCKDKRSDCQERAHKGECKSNPVMMFDNCMKSCGVCFAYEGHPDCKDQDASCAFWASIGECDTNPSYMRTNCRRSCASCL